MNKNVRNDQIQFRHRDVSDNVLKGIYLLLLLAKDQTRDGIVLDNKCLQSILGVKRVYRENARAFAKTIEHLFPYSDIQHDSRNAFVLLLGASGTKPLNPHCLSSLPDPGAIEDRLGVIPVVWSRERQQRVAHGRQEMSS